MKIWTSIMLAKAILLYRDKTSEIKVIEEYCLNKY